MSFAEGYKGSSQTIFTPDDYVGSLQIQSNKEKLRERESYGYNKTILSYNDFRKALSLSINREEYNRLCTASSLSGLGLFNSMHYYDVENGGVYRNEDVAKQVLCDVYGVNVSDYGSLDEAYKTITGFDLEQARKLVTKAYEEALAAGDIHDYDRVLLTFGSSVYNTAIERNFNYLTNCFKELVKNTPLENRLETELINYGTSWASSFRRGRL